MSTTSFPNEAVCRGDWLLGTACQHCRRCLETAPHAIAVLKKADELRSRKLAALRVVIFRASSDYKGSPVISDVFKVQSFEEARRILWAEED